MTNQQIIAKEAVRNGIFTEEEVTEMMEAGDEIPLHTLQGWRIRKCKVKKGEHGLETRLWKRKNRKMSKEENEEETEEHRDFYMTKAYLFTDDQVEEINE